MHREKATYTPIACSIAAHAMLAMSLTSDRKKGAEPIRRLCSRVGKERRTRGFLLLINYEAAALRSGLSIGSVWTTCGLPS